MLHDYFPIVPFRRWIFVQRGAGSILQVFEEWAAFAKSDWDAFRAANGGLMTCPQIVATPDGRDFFAFSYNKDFEFWRSSMIKFCEFSGLQWAEISNGHFLISDGALVEISQCTVETDEGIVRKDK